MAERDANNGQFFQFLSALYAYCPAGGMNLECNNGKMAVGVKHLARGKWCKVAE
jgi:hypothetical protein